MSVAPETMRELLALDPWTFDQTMIGFRRFKTSVDRTEALEQYLAKYDNDGFWKPETPGVDLNAETNYNVHTITFHLALGQALTNRTQDSIESFQKHRRYLIKEDRAEDMENWLGYVDGYISFLQRDRDAFDKAVTPQTRNQDAMQELRDNWGKPLKEFYFIDPNGAASHFMQRTSRQIELNKLDPSIFDQSDKGWRGLSNLEDREYALEMYLYIHATPLEWRKSVPIPADPGTYRFQPDIVWFHLGQVRAMQDKIEPAIEAFQQSKACLEHLIAKETLQPNIDSHRDFIGYIDGTVAFLRGDQPGFDKSFETQQLNRETLTGLLRNWGKPYQQAYLR